MKRQCVAIAAGVLLGGCAAVPATRPSSVTATSIWSWHGIDGSSLTTPHYRVLTTVRDHGLTDRFAAVMEAVYAEYAALVPPTTKDSRPLEVYFFATPDEWETFTRELTGADAPVYLSVGPGGYAYGDRFVCWLFNESDLWGVAAHEGFHQYVARHLTQRMPPALEEGIATTFETTRVTDDAVTIDRRSNARRERGLGDAARATCLLPLDDLIRLHAGDVAGRELIVREGFYGQCWALARTILETPATAAGLRRMLIDLRDGRAVDDVGRSALGGLYRPAAIRPLLARYIASDWPSFLDTFRSNELRLARTSERPE